MSAAILFRPVAVAAGLLMLAGGAPAQTPPTPAPSFIWTIQPLPAQRWDGKRPLPLRIYVGPRQATAVRLLPPDMVEPEGLRSFSGEFLLCGSREGPCAAEPRTLAPNSAHVLWARPAGGEPPAPGTYASTFTLVAAERPEGDRITSSLHVGRDDLRVVGGLLVALGVLIAFLVTRVMRQRADRNAMLQPAALLIDELERVEVERRTYPGDLAQIDASARRLAGELAIKRLSRYLPGIPTFFAAPAAAPVIGGSYQDVLASVSSRIGSLSILVRSGVLAAHAQRLDTDDQTSAGIIDSFIQRLDALAAGELPSPEVMAAAVRTILTEMTGALDVARRVQSDEPTPAPDVGYSSEGLAFSTAALNLGGWAVFALLSMMVGIYVLILRDNDFGQPQDLLLCLLWGFGLPTAGQGLASLNSPGIASGLGMTVTRPA